MTTVKTVSARKSSSGVSKSSKTSPKTKSVDKSALAASVRTIITRVANEKRAAANATKVNSVKPAASAIVPTRRIPKAPAIDFKQGDMIVYPGHGVGKIAALTTSKIGGVECKFYEISFGEESGSKGMVIKVPMAQAQSVGLRRVIDKKAIEDVYDILRDRKSKIDTQTWNRRFREYSQKLKTGSVFEIAEVIRDLSLLGIDKELSFGEKRMLDSAQALLVSEIAVAKSKTQEKIMGEIQAIFQ